MVVKTRNCPYAPPSSVIGLLRQMRTRNLPPAVDSNYLRGRGFSAVIAARVRTTIRYLGFIDIDDEPRESLQSLVRSQTDAEYRTLLAKAVRRAYADIFKVADPSRHAQHEIVEAFQAFEPASQHDRMTILFLGLCHEADIPIQENLRLPGSTQPWSRPNSTRTPAIVRQRSPRRTALQVAPALESDVLWGLIKDLPSPQATFPMKKQDAWLDTMRTAVRYVYDSEDTADPKNPK